MISVQGLMQRWRPQQRLGCDCGSASVKAVQLKSMKDRMVLVRHAEHAVEWEADPGHVKTQIAAFLKSLDAAHSECGLNLPYTNLLIRVVELAKMPERDLRLAIRWNFRKDIEGALENIQVAYTDIAKDQQSRRMLMAYGADRAVLEARRAFGREVGLRLAILEPNPSALLAAFAHSVPMEPKTCYILVDIGFERGTFMVFAADSVIFVREIPGITLDQLASNLLPNDSTAIQRRTLMQQLLRGQLELPESQDQVMREFYRQWLVEIQRGIDTFIAEHKKEGVPGLNRIHLCGGGALLPEIANVAQRNLGVEAVVWNPFANIVDADGNPVTVEAAPLYGVAVGLALPQD